ncbi:MAG: cation transporter [Clostridiales bacterium]|nr:cation transporter [Clostridiales bacterium]
MKREPGERTLLTSVILSAPGPVVVGIGLFLGRSSTQIADFVRRSAELVAIVVSFLVYRMANRGNADRGRLERIAKLCVGGAMCLSGALMLFIAFFSKSAEKGNVLPGLAIAVLGVVTNTWLWLRYRKLDRGKPDAILRAQSRIYRAKSLVDACVTAALLTVAIAPGAPAAHFMDIGGSIVVAVYLVVNGVLVPRATSAATSRGIRRA